MRAENVKIVHNDMEFEVTVEELRTFYNSMKLFFGDNQEYIPFTQPGYIPPPVYGPTCTTASDMSEEEISLILRCKQ